MLRASDDNFPATKPHPTRRERPRALAQQRPALRQLGYQWQFNGLNLANGGRVSGATSGNLTISTIDQLADTGSYTLVVSNAAGMITSAVASLTVLAAPSIITPPANLAAAVGSNATLTVTAAGSAPLSYQWQFNSANLSGATSSTLSLTNLTLTSAGSYSVIVTNSFGRPP